MEGILKNCCQADNESIQQGTKELREALKKPEAIPALCNVVVSAQDLQIRQYAAVVLGRRMQKYRNWAKLAAEDRAVIKTGILQALEREPEKPVRNSIVFFIGAVMIHENANNGWRNAWPELHHYLFTSSCSEDQSVRELALNRLSLLVDLNPKLFIEDADNLCALVVNTIKMFPVDSALPPCVVDALDILKSLALGTQNIQSVVNTAYEVLPFILKMIYQGALASQGDTIKYLRLLDDLSDSVPSVFDPQLKTVVTLCLDLGKEPKIDREVRMRALALLGLLITKKKKALIKQDLVQPIVDTLFLIVATPPSEPEDLDDEDDSPSSVANQTLDSLALNLPPHKVVDPMLKHIKQGIESPEPYHRKAACLSMAVMVEGCAEYIRTKHLTTFMKYVLKSVQDESLVVSNAALFTLGQFSEHLQPDVSQYSEQVMPILLTYLNHTCQKMGQNGDAPDSGLDLVTRIFYALEMFCENLNERLAPYLDEVVKRLLDIFTGTNSVKVRELAISALNSSAIAAKERMVGYVPRILSVLHTFLTQPQNEETLSLQIHAVDTLAVLARSLGKENFRPLAEESLQIALNILVANHADDPDLRRVTYGLLGSLSAIMGEDMQKCMQTVVTLMIGALKSEEGNQLLEVEDGDANQFVIYDDVSDENDEEDIGDDSDRSEDFDGQVHIEDAFSEEKEEACSAIAELAKNTGSAFLPFYEECFTQLVRMASHPGGSVKAAGLDALAELTIVMGEFAPGREEDQQKAVAFIVPKCVEVIQTDEDRDVVATAMDALDKLLINLKSKVLQAEGHKEAIVNSVMQVLTGKTQCQEDNYEEDGEGDAEQDEVLYEYAGNLIPSLGKAMPLEQFLELFQCVLPFLLSKVQDHNSDAQKSFVAGTFAETLSILGDHAGTYFNQLLSLFMKLSSDANDEVRSNAFFGLGELVLYAKDAAFGSYPAILVHLSEAVSKETVATNLDNICGAIARMIISNTSLIPIESVLPVFLEKLPLREDFEENLSVFQSFYHLYQLGNPTLRQLIPGIVRVAIGVLYRKEDTKRETLNYIVRLLTSIKQDFPDDFQTVTSDLLPEQLQLLQTRLAEADIH